MVGSIKVAGVVTLIALLGTDVGSHAAAAFLKSDSPDKEPVCVGLDCLWPKGRMDWVAFATLLLFVATFLLFMATLYLVKTAQAELANSRGENKLVREENKAERTVSACVRYETATIARSVEALRGVGAAVEYNSILHAHHVNILLNYLDTISIGIRQGVYDERIAKDHLHYIVEKQCSLYLNVPILSTIGLTMVNYQDLIELRTAWK